MGYFIDAVLLTLFCLIVLTPWFMLLVEIYRRKDLQLFEEQTSLMITEDMPWFVTIFSTLAYILASISIGKGLTEEAVASFILQIILIPFVIIWAFARLQLKGKERNNRLVTVLGAYVALFSTFLLFFLFFYWITGEIFEIMFNSYIVVMTIGPFFVLIGLTLWKYIGSEKAYMEPIKKAGAQYGTMDFVKIVIDVENNQKEAQKIKLSILQKYTKHCPGFEQKNQNDHKSAREINDIFKLKYGFHGYPRKILGLLLRSISLPLRIFFGGIINARRMNRIFQKAKKNEIWHYPPQYRNAEQCLAQLDVIVWKERFQVHLMDMFRTTLRWILYDYYRHPDKAHREITSAFFAETGSFIDEVDALYKQKLALYRQLADSLQHDPLQQQKAEKQYNFINKYYTRSIPRLKEAISRAQLVLNNITVD